MNAMKLATSRLLLQCLPTAPHAKTLPSTWIRNINFVNNKLAPYETDGRLLATDGPCQVQSQMTQKLVVQWHDPTFSRNLAWSVNNHFYAFFNSF